MNLLYTSMNLSPIEEAMADILTKKKKLVFGNKLDGHDHHVFKISGDAFMLALRGLGLGQSILHSGGA